jgi:drug/metabolite transporter (DMT)-like permease
MKKKINIKDILILQLAVALFSGASVMSKFASGEEFLSFNFILFMAIEVAILGVYAILWQQLLKRFDLSIAYANKAMVLLWYMVWAMAIFREQIGIKNYIGVAIVIVGILFINRPEKDENDAEPKQVEEGEGE